MPLSLRQQRFVEAYLAEPNGTNAAMAAGYAPTSARAHSSKLLKMPAVKEAIDSAKAASATRAQAHSDRAVVTDDMILRELARIAFADIRRLTTWTAGTIAMVDSVDVDADTAASLSEVSETRSGRETRLSVKTHSKLQALTLLARIRGLLDRREPEAEDAQDIADDEDPPVVPEAEAGG